MINEEYGLNATVQLSEDKDSDGENLILVVFKPKEEVNNDKNFEENSYLSKGEDENVILSHVVNFDPEKTLFKEDGKKSYVTIFNTHMYVNKEDVKSCFAVYAKAMKNIDNWVEIPDHDKDNL
jgi:hypothetical protein